MNGQVPSRLDDDGHAAVRPLTGRLPGPGEQAKGARLRGQELAERIRKTAERLQQVRATAKALIREVKATTPSP